MSVFILFLPVIFAVGAYLFVKNMLEGRSISENPIESILGSYIDKNINKEYSIYRATGVGNFTVEQGDVTYEGKWSKLQHTPNPTSQLSFRMDALQYALKSHDKDSLTWEVYSDLSQVPYVEHWSRIRDDSVEDSAIDFSGGVSGDVNQNDDAVEQVTSMQENSEEAEAEAEQRVLSERQKQDVDQRSQALSSNPVERNPFRTGTWRSSVRNSKTIIITEIGDRVYQFEGEWGKKIADLRNGNFVLRYGNWGPGKLEGDSKIVWTKYKGNHWYAD